MKRIDRRDLPSGFRYYRSSDRAFLSYVSFLNGEDFALVPVSRTEIGWVKKFWNQKLAIARFEKIDTEPQIELLKDMGYAHGVMIWIPWSVGEMPDGWKKLPVYLAKNLIQSTRMGWSPLESEQFFDKWRSSAKWTRKKAQRMMAEGLIKIEQVEASAWGEVYQKSVQKYATRPIYEQAQKYMSDYYPASLRHYLAYVGDRPLGGVLMLDQNEATNEKPTTTTYFAAFLEEDGKPYCLGTALLDRAMSDSFLMGIKYINFDHFRDSRQTHSFQGFTDFKEKIAQYDTIFEDMWIRWF